MSLNKADYMGQLASEIHLVAVAHEIHLKGLFLQTMLTIIVLCYECSGSDCEVCR